MRRSSEQLEYRKSPRQLVGERLALAALTACMAYGLDSDSPPIPPDCPPRTPSSNEFVYLHDADLYLGNERIRLAGANIFYLALSPLEGGSYASDQEIYDVLVSAKQMGANVVRVHLSSVGHPLSIEPRLGEFQEEAFRSLDYAIELAGQLGIKLIFPLIDNWDYYHGGRHVFTRWRGVESEAFFSDQQVRADVMEYIKQVITHVNSRTGVPYYEDPTIIAWQIGNELAQGEAKSIADWTLAMAEHIRQLAPDQLIIDARSANSIGNSRWEPDVLTSCNIDAVSVHFYPLTTSSISHWSALATLFGKAVLFDEYSTHEQPNQPNTPWLQPVTLDVFHAALLADEHLDMAAFWSLWSFVPRDRANILGAARLYPHPDSYTVHYGSRQAYNLSNFIHTFRQIPQTNDLDLPSPRLFIQQTVAGLEFTWRGSIGAASYILERSVDSGTTWEVVLGGLTDVEAVAVIATPQPTHAEYRLVPVGGDERVGPASNVVMPAPIREKPRPVSQPVVHSPTKWPTTKMLRRTTAGLSPQQRPVFDGRMTRSQRPPGQW